MSIDPMNRRLVLASFFAFVCSAPSLTQAAEEGGHSPGQGRGGNGGGSHSGGQHGRPEGGHSSDEEHDHTTGETGDDEHDHTTGGPDDEEHDHTTGEDHGTEGKGKGSKKFQGGETTAVSGFGRGRSLEDRVLKFPDF